MTAARPLVLYIQPDTLHWRSPLLWALGEDFDVVEVTPVSARGGVREEPPSSAPARRATVRLPLPFNRLASVHAANQRLAAPRLRRLAADLGHRAGFLWFTHPAWQPLAAAMAPAFVSVYDCTDLYEGFTDSSPAELSRVRHFERAIMASDGLAFAVSRPLARHLEELGPRPVHELPNFVSPAAGAPADPPRGLPHPVLGVAGNLNERLDYGLLADAAAAFPDGCLLLAGRQGPGDGGRAALRELERRPNVRSTGTLPQPRLQAAIRAMDVALLPLVDSPMNRHCSPIKAFDYVAAGRPVVATAVADLDRFDDLVCVAPDAGAFVDAVRGAVERGPAPPPPAWVEANSAAGRAREAAVILRRHLDA